MPSWNESEYVRRATDIAREFATLKKPLNDLCEKVARDEAMNPDEIRTLVRLSNVAAFQHLFKDRQGDKMVEFDVGNPESVIQRIQSSVQDPPQSANIHNDKLAAECPDMMREIRLGRKFDAPLEKVAADAEEKLPPTDIVILNMRKLAHEFDIERRMAGHKWEDLLAKLAHVFKRPASYGPNYDAFEKDAMAEFGMEVTPELGELRAMLRKPAVTFEPEKVAHLQERHVTDETAELLLMKEALEARQAYAKLKNGIEWLTANTPKV